MFENDGYKIVNYDEYCPTCKDLDTPEADQPCDECLANPINLHSHKPTKYTAAE